MARKHTAYTVQSAHVGAGYASIDGVLEYAGVAHPSLTAHLLATLGVLLLSIPSPGVGPLLPLPVYSCWGNKHYNELPDSSSCQGYDLLPNQPMDPPYYFWDCGQSTTGWWQPFNFRAGILIATRALLTLFSCICLDVYSRRRVVVVAMGVFFVFSFTRTFSPTREVAIMALTFESAAAEASIIGLLLIVLENSIQKECVRSVCLALLGHTIAVGVVAPAIDTFLGRQTWQQLAKSIPAAGFVLLLWWMPGSVRWTLGSQDWVNAGFMFPKTHNILLDQTMKPKLVVVQQETQRCLSSAGCSGSSLRESVGPVFLTRSLLRVFLIGSVCAATYGLTVGTRLIVDPNPYNRGSERGLAYGAMELSVLMALALLLGRVSARALLVISLAMLSTTTALTTLTRSIGAVSCPADVVLSLMGHGSAVLAGVALVLSLWRVTPTHSRGAVTGFVWCWVVIGFALAQLYCDFIDSLNPPILQYSLKAYVCAGFCMLAALLALLLPSTPSVLPDVLSHLSDYREKEDNEFELNSLENTRL